MTSGGKVDIFAPNRKQPYKFYQKKEEKVPPTTEKVDVSEGYGYYSQVVDQSNFGRRLMPVLWSRIEKIGEMVRVAWPRSVSISSLFIIETAIDKKIPRATARGLSHIYFYRTNLFRNSSIGSFSTLSFFQSGREWTFTGTLCAGL